MQARVRERDSVAGNGCLAERWSLTSRYDQAAFTVVNWNARLYAAGRHGFGVAEYSSNTNG